jgi:hypothetical protein
VRDILAFYARQAAERPAEAAWAWRMGELAERLLTGGTLAGFALVPWDWQSFGVVPADRAAAPDESPCLGVWLDDPLPIYCVQARARPDGEMLELRMPIGVEEACATVAELLPRVAALG